MLRFKHSLYTATALYILLFCTTGHATTIHIEYIDEEGGGFFDDTSVSPLESNPGETLGEQRRYALEWAMDVVAKQIHSPFGLGIEVYFSEDLGDVCARASANPTIVDSSNASDWGNTLEAETIYPHALENALSYEWQLDTYGEFGATLEENIHMQIGFGGNCPESLEAGLEDVNNSSSERRLAQTVMHEVIHGLGFGSQIIDVDQVEFFDNVFEDEHGVYQVFPDDFFAEGLDLDLVDNGDGTLRLYQEEEDGDYMNGYPGILDRQLVIKEGSDVTSITNSTNAERYAAANGDSVFYQGTDTTRAIAFDELTSGVDGSGRFEMHTYEGEEQDGQALSHIDADVFPAQMMASVGAATYDWGMAAYVLSDIGWGCASDIELTANESDSDFDILIDNPSDCTFNNIVFQTSIPEGITLENIDAAPGICTEESEKLVCEFLEMTANDTLRITFDAVEETVTEESSYSEYLFDMDVDVNDFHVDRLGTNNFAKTTYAVGTEPVPEPEDNSNSGTVGGGSTNGGCVASATPILTNIAYASTGGPAGFTLAFAMMPLLMGLMAKVKRSTRLGRGTKLAMLAVLSLGLMACGGSGGGC